MESDSTEPPTIPFATDSEICRELTQIENALISIQVSAGSMARRAATLRQKLEPRQPEAA